MANEQQTSPANQDRGFRVGALSPEEAERFAALFIPTWDLPPEVPTDGPDPGFRAAPSDTFDVALIASPGAAQIPDSAAAAPAAKKKESKKTMMGLAASVAPVDFIAPVVAPVVEPIDAPVVAAINAQSNAPMAANAPIASVVVTPERPSAKQTMMGISAPIAAPTPPTPAQVSVSRSDAPPPRTDLQAVAVAKPVFAPTRNDALLSVDTTDSYAAMKKKPPYAIIVGGIAVLAIGGIFLLTRGPDKADVKADEKATVTDPQKLPDPNTVTPTTTSTTTAAANPATTNTTSTTSTMGASATTAAAATATATATATAALTAAAIAEPPPKPTVTAKAAPTPPPPPKPTVTAKPPKVTPPPPKPTVTAKPPGKKPPAVKEDF